MLKVTISNEDGEVYVTAKVLMYSKSLRQWILEDEEGDQPTATELLADAARWDQENK